MRKTKMSEAEEQDLDQDLEQDYTEIELQAMDKGWNPDKEAVLDSGKEFISAGEFVRNQSLFDEIHSLKREMNKQKKSQDATISGLKKANELDRKKAYDKAIKDLKAQKKEAIGEEDLTKVMEIDEQIDDLREEQEKEVKVEEEQPEDNRAEWQEAATDFLKNPDNSWYKADKDMQEYSDFVGMRLAAEHPEDPDYVYVEMVKRVKKQFPEKFQNKERKRPAKVAGGKQGGKETKTSRKSKHRLSELEPEVQQMAREQMRLYDMTEDQYCEDYFGE